MFRKINFIKRKSIDILIWNSFNEEFIINNLPKSIKYEVLEISSKRIDFVSEFKFILYLIRFNFKNSLSTAWTISLFKIFNPKIIITYNSTTPFNENVVKFFKRIKFYNIQYCLEAPSHSLKNYQNYLAWGYHSLNYFKKNSIEYLSYNTIGSLKLATYLEQSKLVIKSYDIAIISTYRYVYDTLDLIKYSNDDQKLFLPLFTILNKHLNNEKKLITELAKLNTFKMCLLFSNSEKSELERIGEIKFYSSLQNEVDLISKNKLSSYHYSNSANLIITTDSALGFEMIGLGKKVLFLLNSEEILKYYDEIGIEINYFNKLPYFLKSSTNFDEFLNKINFLNKLSINEYRELTIEARNEFCIDSSKTKSKFLKALNLQNDY